jgi:hypothetical protein
LATIHRNYKLKKITIIEFRVIFVDIFNTVEGRNLSIFINPSTYGDLIPISYCDVRRFPAGYLNLEQNFAGVYAN